MAKFKISNSEVAKLSNAPQFDFPKYTTQIINLVNSNAQGTRPEVVGQMSDLVKEFEGSSIEDWITWYTEREPEAVSKATDRIWAKFQDMKAAFDLIDRVMVENWVKDLLHTKTFCGLRFQAAIIAAVAEQLEKPWREANPQEESQGIDGYIGERPVQVKPLTYRQKELLPEHIDIPIIFYDKKKDGISIEYDTI